MSNEYHVFTYSESGVDHEQAFIFEVERKSDEDFICLKELWILTTQGNGEVKSRLFLGDMLKKIGYNVGGNVTDEGVHTIMDMFKEVLPKDKLMEMEIDLYKKEVESCTNETEKLLKASELSELLHNENNKPELQKIIDSIITKQAKDQT